MAGVFALDGWFHGSLTRTDDDRRQARLLLGLAVAMVVGGVGIVVQQTTLGRPEVARDFGAMVALGLVSISSMRWVGSRRLIANLIPLLVLVGITIVNMNNDGLGFPSFFSLVLVPQSAFLLAGPRSGAVYALLALAEMVLLYVGHPGVPEGGTNWAAIQLSGGAVVLFTVSGLTWAYESLKGETLRQLEEERRRADAASQSKSEFLANVSHEIRTPMNGVLGMLELLEQRVEGEDAEMVGVAAESGRALLALINDVLDMSKLEAGSLELLRSECDLVELSAQVVELFRVRAQAKGLALEWRPPHPRPPRVWTDPQRMRQVLVNLLGNAVKFTDAGFVRLTLDAELRGERARLRFVVEDSGCGIPEAAQEKVFERFHQGDGSATRRYGGTGLGLAICLEIVNRLEGTIEVDSAPERGSRFVVDLTFDVAPPATEETRAPRVDAEAPAIASRVLVVEDDATNRLVCRRMLQRLGVPCEVAEHGGQAIELIAEDRFDLIFMDCQMPVLDGFETTEAIRKMDSEVARIPIIALTAQALAGDKEACIAAGMDDYITKPVTLDALRRSIERWSGRAR